MNTEPVLTRQAFTQKFGLDLDNCRCQEKRPHWDRT